jgi:tetratricopeptide (TPR) repeat protein
LDFPADHTVLRAFEINRRIRSTLLAAGVLEQTPGHGQERKYYVHPLMRRTLPFRKLYDFDTMRFVGKALQDLAKGARSSGEHLKSFCYIQSANVLFQSARAHRECWNLDVMFVDPLVSTINEILGRGAPKGDRSDEIKERNQRAVRAQLDAALAECPNHPDALYSMIRQLQQQRSDNDKFLNLFKRIRESAATPDSFHREASFFRNKRVLTEVKSVLEAGIKQFPQSATLLRRLADTEFRLGQTATAEKMLAAAVESQPKMPENFSLMGKILFNQGQEQWAKAKESFDMARTLGPANSVLLVREAELLRAHGLAASDLASGMPFFKEAQEKLDEAIELDRSYHSARVTKAKIQLDILDKRGDTASEEELENIKALLRPALKRKDNADAYIQQARLLIQLNTVEDIERLLDKAYKIEKNRHELYYVRGILYFKQENPDRAKQSFETALLHTPKSAPEHGVYEAAAAQMLEMIKTGKFTVKTDGQPAEKSNEEQGFRTEATVKVRKRAQPKKAEDEQVDESEDAPTDNT